MRYYNHSGSSSGSVVSGCGNIFGFMLTAGSAAGTATIKDSTDTSGEQIYEISAPANTSSPLHDLHNINGVRYATGIYVTVGGGARYRIFYE